MHELGQEPKNQKSEFNGLSSEICEVIRDKEFQSTVNKFVPKRHTIFHLFRGAGFVVALAAGLFGYLLKANSEADDRRAEMIHKIIDEKEKWAQKVDIGILDLRRTRFLLKYDCDHHKSQSLDEREKVRELARFDFAKTYAGIDEIFGEAVIQICRDFTKFDASIRDVCAKNTPDDEVWRAYLLKINEQMHISIRKDRGKLEELGHGALGNIFRVL